MLTQNKLKSLSITELRKIAGALGIKDSSKLRFEDKDELIELITLLVSISAIKSKL